MASSTNRQEKETVIMMNDAAIIQARIDLAAALRCAVRMGLNEGICNHFSLTVPGHPDHFFINPQGLHWSEVTPGDLMILHESGEIVAGKHQVERTAFFIHLGVHRQSKKACVLHTHMPHATALTLIEDGKLEWCNQSALRFYDRIVYDNEYGGTAACEEEGMRIGRAMGKADVMFMVHHGVIVCGPTVAWALDDLYYLERACTAQVLAQSTGKRLKMTPEQLRARVAQEIGMERQQSDLHFEALKRMLDREEPGWSRLD
jgi:ribulose-5-phosphate 4-epimerase/fuculose-1-phosphate aldolase